MQSRGTSGARQNAGVKLQLHWVGCVEGSLRSRCTSAPCTSVYQWLLHQANSQDPANIQFPNPLRRKKLLGLQPSVDRTNYRLTMPYPKCLGPSLDFSQLCNIHRYIMKYPTNETLHMQLIFISCTFESHCGRHSCPVFCVRLCFEPPFHTRPRMEFSTCVSMWMFKTFWVLEEFGFLIFRLGMSNLRGHWKNT